MHDEGKRGVAAGGGVNRAQLEWEDEGDLRAAVGSAGSGATSSPGSVSGEGVEGNGAKGGATGDPLRGAIDIETQATDGDRDREIANEAAALGHGTDSLTTGALSGIGGGPTGAEALNAGAGRITPVQRGRR